MPVRVRSRWAPDREASPQGVRWDAHSTLPQIGPDDAFKEVIRKLSTYFADVIELPSSFEQLRTTSAGDCLKVLVDHLGKTCGNPAIVNALLALRWHYAAEREHRGLSEARANACEIVAWRFLCRQSERDAVDYCLHEIPGREALDANPVAAPKFSPTLPGTDEENPAELSPLLSGLRRTPTSNFRSATRRAELQSAIPRLTLSSAAATEDPRNTTTPGATSFKNLNALEIAVIADAKRFLAQHIVQKIITGIWHGDVIFWDSVAADSVKKPRWYNIRTADPYSRLRVPKYLKAYEVAFFVAFLGLYYCVVVERSFVYIPPVEIVFYFWLVSFAYDEFQEWADAGLFYMSDIWNLFDVMMILIGVVFAMLRIIGISIGSHDINDVAFDVLSLEALLVIPRIGSFLSLSPYWGTLIPCLKEMGKDFIKFMILVIIIYLGFLTTFSLMARDQFTLGDMTWRITQIFYGNTGVGFDIMQDIDRNFGPPLMILFITLSSILLTGSLTGMLSNSFSRVMAQAREEYLYFYSVYVLEAATSTRLTHFYPPLNLVALIFFRPWQIIFAKDDRFRHGRVMALKVTHVPIVATIYLYEWLHRKAGKYTPPVGDLVGEGDTNDWAGFQGGRARSGSEAPKRWSSRRTPNRGGRRLSVDHLSPDARLGVRAPSNGRSPVSEPDEDDVSNAELLRRIEGLTAAVNRLQQRSADR